MFTRSLLGICCLFAITFAACKKDSASPAGSGGTTVPSELVAVWLAQSATVNGTATDLSIVFQWEPTTVSARVTITAAGTYTYQEFDAGNAITYTQTGTAAFNGNTITLTVTAENGQPVNPPSVFLAGTWAVNGNQLTVSTTVSGNAIVIIFSKT